MNYIYNICDFVVWQRFSGENGAGQYYKQEEASRDQINSGESWQENMSETMKRRKSHIQIICQHYTYRTYSRRKGVFFLAKPEHIAYCEVPKVACTFWKRIIRFLNKDHLPKISSPLDIPRGFVHMGKRINTTLIHLENNTKRSPELLNTEKTVMFTRDPYSRIWSAYLDKLFLPDFWSSVGVPAIKAKRKNATKHSLQCGDDVTFEEFLRHILPQEKRLRIDPVFAHFTPVHGVCNPCAVNFTYIGKIETFKDDVRYILNDTGLNSLLKMNLFNNTAVSEIKSLSEDYLGRVTNRNTECKNITVICERLWNVFQINGYIGFEKPFPSDKLRQIKSLRDIKQRFTLLALSEHEKGLTLHKLWKRQRRSSLVKAYKALPADLLQEFQAVYKIDFELFGYSKAPVDIFS